MLEDLVIYILGDKIKNIREKKYLYEFIKSDYIE